ncbi:hypothetical protein NECAME_07469 [Necator americanus]|uniref:DUF7027 domain-containing protein n=1 Tax=Necator americanus TaxID=51031 RepID=W2TN92_NECAM|nr:hypothetical protein NECAME_07469 [Necator americanus]ETN83233.1 hypothetical protein NECAME_07469 [Necator americanus]
MPEKNEQEGFTQKFGKKPLLLAIFFCSCGNLPRNLVERLTFFSLPPIFFIFTSKFQSPTYFEVCLISMMILMAVTSTMLIIGIHRHDTRLIYPTLIARVLLIIFVQVCSVFCSVLNLTPMYTVTSKVKKRTGKYTDEKEPNVALRLVMLVFAMLVITVLVFYCIYLVVRCLQYQKSYCRMKERRASLIHASMIDPDAGSRRASSLPGLP